MATWTLQVPALLAGNSVKNPAFRCDVFVLRVPSLAQIELYVPVPCCAEAGAAGRLMSWQSVHASAAAPPVSP